MNQNVVRSIFLRAGLAAAAVASISLFGIRGHSAPAASAGDDLVKRGAYLVTVVGCHDCHSPKIFTEKGPEPDPARLLSGHPAGTRLPELDLNQVSPTGWVYFSNDLTVAVGPWGISYAANLTSDLETGIGRWNEEAFITTMRSGLHWGVGPALLPPMPWQNLAAASDDDLKAIFAYLQSVKPVHNPVPGPLTLEELRKKMAEGR